MQGRPVVKGIMWIADHFADVGFAQVTRGGLLKSSLELIGACADVSLTAVLDVLDGRPGRVLVAGCPLAAFSVDADFGSFTMTMPF